ncbi:hypothetical protein [Pontibacter ruber]|uniref:Type II CBASS E2 protein domain-containing protein n=1 Tax=Pontibacter ruber TaxID=1343895 RepID=A0ABW5CZQ2_9BACT|nr:hypothetical protein [Pontibacter ruber]
MKSAYPQFKHKKKDNGSIEFVGNLTVRPELPTYTVSLEYRGSKSPIVRVLNPTLVENPPHFYSDSQSLCLYHPDNYKWKRENLVAKEIVAWTSGWIYFYEVWLQTGIWYGPDAHSNKLIKKKDNI